MKTQTLERFIKETRFDFDKKFPCLVKPVGYTFDRNGKKEEVEGMTYEKDSVLSFLSTKLQQAGEVVREEEKQKVLQGLELWFNTHDKLSKSFMTNDLIKFIYEEK